MPPGVHIRFLGSGDAFGSGGRLQTAILVETGGARSLLDCGATSLVALKRADVDPVTIDRILVTHLHGDHFGGIPFFLLDGQFSRRQRPLLVAGPLGLRERLDQAMEVLFPGSSRVERRFAIEIVEMSARRTADLGSLRVTPYEVVHASGAPSLALRLEVGSRIIAYSGDTEWTDELLEASADADLFICEAYFFEKRIPFHLDYKTLMERRREITAKRVVLTHMSSDMLSRRSEVSLPCADDGLEIVL